MEESRRGGQEGRREGGKARAHLLGPICSNMKYRNFKNHLSKKERIPSLTSTAIQHPHHNIEGGRGRYPNTQGVVVRCLCVHSSPPPHPRHRMLCVVVFVCLGQTVYVLGEEGGYIYVCMRQVCWLL